MSKINDHYINNLNKLTSEVLENEPITKTTRILIETLVSTVNFLYEENKDLKVRIIKLENDVEDLKKKLNKNSSNSHLPPSMDRYKKKPKEIRNKNKNKKTGGQPGHKGATLRMTSAPDEIIQYKLKGKCRFCGDSLSGLKNKSITKRQEFNIDFKTVVTEHQNESGVCSCGMKHGTKARGPSACASSPSAERVTRRCAPGRPQRPPSVAAARCTPCSAGRIGAQWAVDLLALTRPALPCASPPLRRQPPWPC